MKMKLIQVLTCFCGKICQSISYTGIEVAYINNFFGVLSFIHPNSYQYIGTRTSVNYIKDAPIAGIKAKRKVKTVRDKMRQWKNVRDHTLEVDRDQDRIRAQGERTECTSADKLKSIQVTYSKTESTIEGKGKWKT